MNPTSKQVTFSRKSLLAQGCPHDMKKKEMIKKDLSYRDTRLLFVSGHFYDPEIRYTKQHAVTVLPCLPKIHEDMSLMQTDEVYDEILHPLKPGNLGCNTDEDYVNVKPRLYKGAIM